MTLSTTLTDQRGMYKVTLTGATSVANAGLGALANPEGVLLGITRVFGYFRTGSTGAANLDIGVTTVAAKASDIASAMDMVEATVGGKLIHLPAVQTAETENPTAKWAANTYITFTGSGDSTGLDADIFIEYVRLA